MAVVLSAIAAGICNHYFLRLVERIGMLPFIIYRVLLSVTIIAILS
jgi:undecaprenyl-diphosphatase